MFALLSGERHIVETPDIPIWFGKSGNLAMMGEAVKKF